MKQKYNHSKTLGFRWRKIVHYSLIVCILLIQLIIAGFFYNEMVNRKNLSLIEKQLKVVESLGNLTDTSKKELLTAQDYFQKYLVSQDEKYLQSYFGAVSRLGNNVDRINRYGNQFPEIKDITMLQRSDSSQVHQFRSLSDSAYQYSGGSGLKLKTKLPEIQRYKLDYNFDKFDVQTKTYSDTIKKKGFFGRLGDAISGKVNVRKDSTVVMVKQREMQNAANIKADFDSILNLVNNHYTEQVRKIQVNLNTNRQDNGKFFRVFDHLFVSASGLMNMYDKAVKNSKSELQKEYDRQNSMSNRIRNYLVLGLMVLMFIVSVLIMYLTRIAFIYEHRLNAANKQIQEHLNFKNRILGMLSHELRSPLKIIGIFINRIHKKTNDDSVKEYLKSVSFTNNTLLMQANQILEYTKNHQVENKLVPAVFNLKDEITSILASIEPYIETRNNRFIIDERIAPDLVVFSDNTKINQIYMNIIGNANKFTENGQIKVTVYTEPVNEATVAMHTIISDTGVGISESDLEKIFEPYYQGIISDEVENLGAGLGLSLCKQLIALYPGNISVTSERNKGTTVSFYIHLTIHHES